MGVGADEQAQKRENRKNKGEKDTQRTTFPLDGFI